MRTLEKAQEAGVLGGPLLWLVPSHQACTHLAGFFLPHSPTPTRNTLPPTIQFGHATLFLLGPSVQSATPPDIRSTLRGH